MRPLYSLLSLPVLLSTLVDANSFFCSHIRAQGKSFNLEKLGGPHSTSWLDEHDSPELHNYTFTVDICAPLKKTKEKTVQCQTGTNVCGIKNTWNSETDPDQKEVVSLPIPIAGTLTDSGSALEPFFTLLNKTDDEANGLRIELNGGKLGKTKQQAIIDFRCDESRTGNDRRDTLKPNADEDENEDNKSLTFKSYEDDEEKKTKVLRLQWKTKYVCEEFEEDDDESTSQSSWGFFTWFILLLFMGVSAYLIFGSWLNYNRYGARGWDLLPHGDTIRDVPYIFKDFSRKVLDTFSGGGSRGGYSAV